MLPFSMAAICFILPLVRPDGPGAVSAGSFLASLATSVGLRSQVGALCAVSLVASSGSACG